MPMRCRWKMLWPRCRCRWWPRCRLFGKSDLSGPASVRPGNPDDSLGWQKGNIDPSAQDASPQRVFYWRIWELRRDRDTLSAEEQLRHLKQTRMLLPSLSSKDEQGSAWLALALECATVLDGDSQSTVAAHEALDCLARMLELDPFSVGHLMLTPGLAPLRPLPRCQEMFEQIVGGVRWDRCASCQKLRRSPEGPIAVVGD